jgi:hypothetical protein
MGHTAVEGNISLRDCSEGGTFRSGRSMNYFGELQRIREIRVTEIKNIPWNGINKKRYEIN